MKFCLFAGLVAALLAGCGQKGALVLPDAARHRKPLPVLRPQSPSTPAQPGATPSPAPADGAHPGGPPASTPAPSAAPEATPPPAAAENPPH